MLLANKEGIVVTSPITNLAAAGAANAVVIFTIPILAGQLIGLKSVRILKIHLFNNAAGNQSVLLGAGAAGVGIPAILPAVTSFNNLEDLYDVDHGLPEVETFANITAWPAALAVGGTIDIQLEVAVIG